MDGVDPYQAYLTLANKLFDKQISQDDLNPSAAQLPPLNRTLLDQLAQCAEEAAQTAPRLGWAITAIADAAAVYNEEPFIQALAAWYLGRAANHWAQPKRVTEAIERARRGFESLNEPGWIAACDWQINALAWTKPDVVKAVDTLEKAVAGLISAGMDDFVPHCRLALAYAQILIERFEEALEIIRASEITFTEKGDTINQARCWFTEASCLRRQSHFDQAQKKLEQAMRVFQHEEQPADIAKTHYQCALIHLLRTDDLSIAISHFETAIQIFDICDLDLWQAACFTNLGSVYIQNGLFIQAEDSIKQARISFMRHDVFGLLADNLNDSGKLNTLRGLLHTSFEQFKQAEKIYSQLGMKLRASSTMANIGEVYGKLGRYQDALHYLEQAAKQLESLDNYLRLGTCERYTALIWHRLRQSKHAHEYLDKAVIHYEKAGQKAYISAIHNYRAGIFFEEGKFTEAIDCLEKSLEIASQFGVKPQIGLAYRLLGEALLRTGKHREAYQNLEQALSDFIEMGMSLEQAACLVALGTYFLDVSEPNEAKKAYEEALQLSQGTFPEIDWRAYAGLATLAEAQGHIQLAVHAYRQGMHALAKIRHNFWQPALAGSYLQTPAAFFDKAISLAAKAGNSEDTLQFIESGKATTLLQQLSSNRHTGDRSSQKLNKLRGEIDWLQEQLRVSFNQTNPIQSAIHTRQMRARLADSVTQYDALLAKLERQSDANLTTLNLPHHFKLSSFRNLARQALGESWVALDYHLAEDQLITIIISPDICQIQTSPLLPRVQMVLDACRKTHRNATPLTESDLAVLGNWLIPTSIAEGLTPETTLVLAPHRALHSIPWAALQPGFASQPFVCLCTPCITPSLRSLAFLWDRATQNRHQPPARGLVIGLSRFPNTKEELPSVREEIHVLRATLGTNARYLLENDATWENLKSLRGQDHSEGLSRFVWLHFASHAYADVHTGRLSGFSLWDGEIRLDQLRDLAPLPNLVTFSACNSSYSYIYEGDEHVGLPATCLIAGANSVVGSTQPIIDHAATEFITAFYRHYFEGYSPAQAVAQAQRQMIKKEEETTTWASFTCMGVP